MSRTHKIAVLPGDGIGRELCRKRSSLRGRWQETRSLVCVQGSDCWRGGIDRYRTPLPDESLKVTKGDAVLLGAVGGPKWEGLDYSIRPERALLDYGNSLAQREPAPGQTVCAVDCGFDVEAGSDRRSGSLGGAGNSPGDLLRRPKGSSRTAAERKESIPRYIPRKKSCGSHAWH
jgi:hypothetical protein